MARPRPETVECAREMESRGDEMVRPTKLETTARRRRPEGDRYEARLFGPFQLLRNGRPMSRPAKGRAGARTLLKWFLLNPGVGVELMELSELLWRRRGRSDANKLHVSLHHLRHFLEPDLAARQPSTFIRSDGDGRYWFDLSDRWWTDELEVKRLLGLAEAAEAGGDARAAITAYEGLLEYYERTFLPEDLFDEVFDSFRAFHEVAHHTVQSRLLSLYLTEGLTYKALPCALDILDRDPYCEEAAAAIAEVNLKQGNTLAARTELAGHLLAVQRDLGVKPSPAALQLWERVRAAS